MRPGRYSFYPFSTSPGRGLVSMVVMASQTLLQYPEEFGSGALGCAVREVEDWMD